MKSIYDIIKKFLFVKVTVMKYFSVALFIIVKKFQIISFNDLKFGQCQVLQAEKMHEAKLILGT